MSFPTVVFGRGVVTGTGALNYIDQNYISSGGFRLFIVPTRDMGAASIDIKFTYINQFGDTKTTGVSTAVAAGTTAGTHIQVVLEPGDSGIRDIISIPYFFGGSTGDQFNFESWNEGLGRPPLELTRLDWSSFIPEIMLREWTGKTYPISNTIPILWYTDPMMDIPISIIRSAITEWISEPIIDRMTIAKLYDFADSLGARKEIVAWMPETLSNRDFIGKPLYVFKSWIESVVGQVLSGYVQNVNGQIIRNAFSMILISPPTDVNPSGVTATAEVNPDTGLYQAFLKKVIYDKRFIIVRVGIKNVALEGAGIPVVVDGNQQLPIPYDLQFACPIKNCDFTVTRKIV